MVFSSLFFLCAFLTITVTVHGLCKNIKVKNITLMLFSLFFYAWGEPKWIIMMIITSFIDYLAGLLVEKHKGKALSKVYLALSVIITLGILVVFKYLNFITYNLNLIPSINVPQTNIALPIGISFYTFQAMSYVIDVYRGDVKVQKRYYKLLLYVSMFPQLIAGPIVRYSDINEEIEERHVSLEDFSSGITRFVIGLSKKVILANYLGMLVNSTLGGDIKSLTTVASWTGIIAYFFQIYFDFSGYSDMAIGLGRMFGFHFLENFRYPYAANSITDFWRRWHISLSSFFRDYLYIPLGGNRKFHVRNMFIVWLLTGFWHGASWNFLLWGFYYFVLLVLEKYVYGKKMQSAPKAFQSIYAIFFVIIGWVFFYFEDMSQMLVMFKAMFGMNGVLWAPSDLVVLQNNIVLFAVSVFAVTPIGSKIKQLVDRLENSAGGMIVSRFTTTVFQAVLLFVSVICLVGSTYNPFLYFRF